MGAQQRLISLDSSAQSDQSLLSAWWKLGALATHWAHSEDSDQTGRMSRLNWVFAGRTATLLVLSCVGSKDYNPRFVYCRRQVTRIVLFTYSINETQNQSDLLPRCLQFLTIDCTCKQTKWRCLIRKRGRGAYKASSCIVLLKVTCSPYAQVVKDLDWRATFSSLTNSLLVT